MRTASVRAAQPRPIDPRTDRRWDEFVRAHPDASVYHLGAWASILRTGYGFQPRYLALEGDGGGLEGVLPLMLTRGPLSGKRLRSLPAVPPPAGPLARDEDGVRRLVQGACDVTAELGASVWTWLSRDAGREGFVPGLHLAKRQTGWVAPLGDDADALRRRLKKRSNNLHRSIRKAEAAALVVRETTSLQALRAFYALYLNTMREHRALPRPWRQMRADLVTLGPPGNTRVFLVEHERRVIAGGLFHVFGDTVELLYNGSDRDSLALRPNHALYWEVMRWAIARGIGRFDFGDAPADSSLGRFKAQWGSEPVEEYIYEFRPGGGGEASAFAEMRRRGQVVGGPERESLVSQAWGRAPLALTRAAGAVAYRF
jgi:serine/alanine adding enzyme